MNWSSKAAPTIPLSYALPRGVLATYLGISIAALVTKIAGAASTGGLGALLPLP